MFVLRLCACQESVCVIEDLGEMVVGIGYREIR